VIVAVVVVDGACAGVVESTSDAFAPALQILDLCEQTVELANDKIDFVSQEMASSSSDNNCITLSTLLAGVHWPKMRRNDVAQHALMLCCPTARPNPFLGCSAQKLPRKIFSCRVVQDPRHFFRAQLRFSEHPFGP
jgi:hypothetical protein